MSKAITEVPLYTYDEFGNKVAYEIDDKVFAAPLKIFWSPNAWWMDRIKVELLIDGFKRNLNIQESSILARITRAQWSYFNENHPHFYDIMTRCRSIAGMYAKQTLMAASRKDWKAALALLERTQPAEYGMARAMGVVPDAPESIAQTVESNLFDESGNMVLNEKMSGYLERRREQYGTNNTGEIK